MRAPGAAAIRAPTRRRRPTPMNARPSRIPHGNYRIWDVGFGVASFAWSLVTPSIRRGIENENLSPHANPASMNGSSTLMGCRANPLTKAGTIDQCHHVTWAPSRHRPRRASIESTRRGGDRRADGRRGALRAVGFLEAV